MKTLRLSEADRLAIDRELAKRGLAHFAKMAWPVLEPATKLKWGWALDAICQHLEAVTKGRLTHLLMNVPPGAMKSLLTGVIWPAWEWGPMGLPHNRFIGTAHAQHLAVRDSMRCRRLIESEWYQKRWPVHLVSDQNAKTKFENLATGFREAMAFTSMTGARADRIVLDDPISADNANSDAHLNAARTAFTETLPHRVNNEHSAIVVIMQRLHEADVSGVILELGLNYEHLMIPMRFEEDRRCKTSIGWIDPRTKDGELMFPARFPPSQVEELEKTLGSYATAGQLQQRPAPRGGGMFKRSDFVIVEAAPQCVRWVRAWDLAATNDPNAARTAGCLMGVTATGEYVIADVKKDQLSSAGVERMVRNTAVLDGHAVPGSIPQDPGAGGKAWAAAIIKACRGYAYTASPESGDKVTRASPLAAQVEIGNVMLVRGEWINDFLDEAAQFPSGKFKDQVDAASRAFMELNKPSGAAVSSTYGGYV